MTTDDEKEKCVSIKKYGKDEMNIAVYPICYPSKRVPQDLKYIEYRKEYADKNGNKIERKWIVSGSTVYGFPSEKVERIYVALMCITKEAGFPQIVPFSGYEIERIMGAVKPGAHYKDLKNAMNQFAGITIYTQDSFWDNEERRYITVKDGAFHIIEWWRFNERGKKSEGCFKWNDVIYNSITDKKYVKNLDIEFYYSLEDPLARRLFRFLDKVMAETNKYEIDIFELTGHLGLSYFKHVSKIKERLDPAIAELSERGWIREGEYIKRKGFLRVKFGKGSLGEREYSENVSVAPKRKGHKRGNEKENIEEICENKVLDALVQTGVTKRVAEHLVEEYTADEIKDQIKALQYRKADDAAAVLVAAIQGKWAIPNAYKEKVRKEECREDERKQQLEKKREKDERKEKIAGYISSLMKDDLLELTREAKDLAREEGGAIFRHREVPQYIINAYIHIVAEKRLGIKVGDNAESELM